MIDGTTNWIPIQQAAEMAGFSYWDIRGAVKRVAIKSKTIDGKLRVHTQSVLAWAKRKHALNALEEVT